MGISQDKKLPVLFLYYSFSSQTKNLLQAIEEGLGEHAIAAHWERIEPVEPLRFPLGSIGKTFWMMLTTFFRRRVPIQPLSQEAFANYSLIILAGPTWSYNPSGPVLSLFDRDGKEIFHSKDVVPLISCRGYWRMHWWGLKILLRRSGARVRNLIVFSHPSAEPWRTIGVFLKLAGRVPERMWMSRYYQKYGHTIDQIEEAKRFGAMIGQQMVKGEQIDDLDFTSKLAGA